MRWKGGAHEYCVAFVSANCLLDIGWIVRTAFCRNAHHYAHASCGSFTRYARTTTARPDVVDHDCHVRGSARERLPMASCSLCALRLHELHRTKRVPDYGPDAPRRSTGVHDRLSRDSYAVRMGIVARLSWALSDVTLRVRLSVDRDRNADQSAHGRIRYRIRHRALRFAHDRLQLESLGTFLCATGCGQPTRRRRRVCAVCHRTHAR